MKIFLFVFIFIFISCRHREKMSNEVITEKDFEFPPEWEPQHAVWIDFAGETNWRNPDHAARFEIIETLSRYIIVKVLIDSEYARKKLDSMIISSGTDPSNIRVVTHPVPDYFIRDAGPVFLTNESKLKIADFTWDCYGNAPWCDSIAWLRGTVDNDLAEKFGWEIQSSGLVAEGGGIEASSDALMIFKDYALTRNPGTKPEEIEREFLRIYNKKYIVWIEKTPVLEKNGHKIDNYFGQGANGHIDAFYRFLNDSTILATVVDEKDKMKNPVLMTDFDILQENLIQIKNFKRPDGKPFHIETVSMPDLTLYQNPGVVNSSGEYDGYRYRPGDTLVFVPNIGYANFFITNKAVLFPEYWKEGLPESEKLKDRKTKDILEKYFPDRDIIGLINTLELNWNGGGIHCSTQQEPEIN